MTWQACVRGCSDFYPAADVSHGRGHIRTPMRTTPTHDIRHAAPRRFVVGLTIAASGNSDASPEKGFGLGHRL